MMTHQSGLSPFKLEKLYLDCIDDSGNCFIIYHARLGMWFFRFHYSRIIFSDSADKAIEWYSLRRIMKPDISELIKVENRFLKVSGEWKAVHKSLPALIFRDDSGQELIWDCHHPLTMTQIEFGGNKYAGIGYGETLTLNIKPWNLPVDELRWGRFNSDQDNVTWINWKGPHPLNLLYFNGKEYNDAIVDKDDGISFSDGNIRLVFGKISVVTDGRLSGLFSSAPWMKALFPKRILNVNEVKYKSRTTLLINFELKSIGWSLFENVIWKS
jgi:hypothetical protein